MLESLSIKNVALIESLDLNFASGFNVLTGESGAGKSILIGSISFLLGGKASSQILRQGEKEASVAGVFSISKENKRAREWLLVHGLDIEDDEVVIRRTYNQNAKSSIWISGNPFARAELQEFTSFLIDIHGQHEHQSLFKVGEHRRFLDGFAGIEDEVSHFTKLYASLASLREEYANVLDNKKERENRREMLQFAASEIEEAGLERGERERLEEEKHKLLKFEKLVENLKEVLDFLKEDEGGIYILRHACKCLNDATNIDSSLSAYASRLEDVFYEAQDVRESLASYYSNLNFSGERLEEIQERLSLISHLEKKYGPSITDVLLYYEKAKKELQSLSYGDEGRAILEKKIVALESDMLNLGREITKKRVEYKERLQKEVEDILKTLGMKSVRFVVSIVTREEREGHLEAGPYGFDEVEFLISANEGEDLKPLAKIASGGELSRVMLSLKTALASSDEVETLIFDEIDVGIGGEVALSVANHIKKLSYKKQILLITHLAIIASSADNHIKVEKYAQDGKTFTKACIVGKEERVEEVARMLSGNEISDASFIHAKELLEKHSKGIFNVDE